MMSSRIHIFGASGSGTTTLGLRLANHLHAKFLDTDSYYWLPTNLPFTQKRPPAERVTMIEQDIANIPNWILSGSLCSWGDPLLNHFTAAVFLYLRHEVRMARLAARERQRCGPRIHPGGDMHTTHLQFMSWAQSYDTAKAPTRSRDLHEQWMCKLACPVIRLDSSKPVEELCADALAQVVASPI